LVSYFSPPNELPVTISAAAGDLKLDHFTRERGDAGWEPILAIALAWV
jgi:hypothetical protein